MGTVCQRRQVCRDVRLRYAVNLDDGSSKICIGCSEGQRRGFDIGQGAGDRSSDGNSRWSVVNGDGVVYSCQVAAKGGDGCRLGIVGSGDRDGLSANAWEGGGELRGKSGNC